MLPRLYSVQEIAEAAGVHVQTVKNWIYRGDLHAVRVGGALLRVTERDFQRFIATSSGSLPPRRDREGA